MAKFFVDSLFEHMNQEHLACSILLISHKELPQNAPSSNSHQNTHLSILTRMEFHVLEFLDVQAIKEGPRSGALEEKLIFPFVFLKT